MLSSSPLARSLPGDDAEAHPPPQVLQHPGEMGWQNPCPWRGLCWRVRITSGLQAVQTELPIVWQRCSINTGKINKKRRIFCKKTFQPWVHSFIFKCLLSSRRVEGEVVERVLYSCKFPCHSFIKTHVNHKEMANGSNAAVTSLQSRRT